MDETFRQQVLEELRAIRKLLEEKSTAAAPEAPATEANPPPEESEGETQSAGKRKASAKRKPKKSSNPLVSRIKKISFIAEILKGWNEKGKELRRLERQK